MAWLKGLLVAAAMGAANAVLVFIVDPSSFSFSAGGKKLLSLIAANALVGAALYLKQSPRNGPDPNARGVMFRRD